MTFEPYPAWVEPHSTWIEVVQQLIQQIPDYPPPNCSNAQMVAEQGSGLPHDGLSNIDDSVGNTFRCGPWQVIVNSAAEAALVQQPRQPAFADSLFNYPQWNLQSPG
jgi:hypothetical protein